jgi:hypothetical protein
MTRSPEMADPFPLLLQFWRDGAVVVETPLDLATAAGHTVPEATKLAFRTAIQWDGDIVHRYNPAAEPAHQAAHTAALQRFLSEFHTELSKAVNQLAWCGRGLWAGRIVLIGGGTMLSGSEADFMPVLQSIAAAYVYPAATALAVGSGTEVGLRVLRGYLRKRFAAALNATAAENQG